MASPEAVYPFENSKDSERFYQLSRSLRCVVCQNQDLSESNAPLAEDLRRVIYNQLKAGQTDDQIKAYLSERYGSFILFKPPFTQTTIILWIVPFFLLIFIFCFWCFRVTFKLKRQAQ